MDEDTPQQEHEKPRFLLLPDGCKDLIDALRLQQQQGEVPEVAYPHVLVTAAEPTTASEPPQALPSSVTLTDPVSIRDLASALHLKPYKVVYTLIRLKIFVSDLDAELDFDTASMVCSHYGVAATKAA
ncbi:MAG: hypothetical protein NTV80_10495 [Verrucomicrobia bacterium]|nr:hypothetical protein [Verrucomicrobiota bacterium]